MIEQHRVRIVVFDPSPVYAHGLMACLNDSADLCCVGIATAESEARAAIVQHQAAIVIVASVMSQIDVPSFVRDVLLELPDVRFVALGDPWLDPFPTRLIRAGVSGYLLKDCDARELTAALQVVSQGKIYFSSPIASVLVDQIRRAGETQWRETPYQLELTRREAEVLELVAVGQSNRAIAGALQVSERTVENHVQRVYRKLGVHDRANAVLLAMRHGYVPSFQPELWATREPLDYQRSLPEQSHQRADAEAGPVR